MLNMSDDVYIKHSTSSSKINVDNGNVHQRYANGELVGND